MRKKKIIVGNRFYNKYKTLDTALNAIDNQGIIVLPSGTFSCSEFNINTKKITIRGQDNTVIQLVEGASIRLDDFSELVIENLKIVQTGTVPLLDCYNNSQLKINNCQLEGAAMMNHHTGQFAPVISLHKSTCQIKQTTFNSQINDGILVDQSNLSVIKSNLLNTERYSINGYDSEINVMDSDIRSVYLSRSKFVGNSNNFKQSISSLFALKAENNSQVDLELTTLENCYNGFYLGKNTTLTSKQLASATIHEHFLFIGKNAVASLVNGTVKKQLDENFYNSSTKPFIDVQGGQLSIDNYEFLSINAELLTAKNADITLNNISAVCDAHSLILDNTVAKLCKVHTDANIISDNSKIACHSCKIISDTTPYSFILHNSSVYNVFKNEEHLEPSAIYSVNSDTHFNHPVKIYNENNKIQIDRLLYGNQFEKLHDYTDSKKLPFDFSIDVI
ncbi:hypothetical protein [Vagococcus intermedius]|uniref:Uncharacterized protein n=1 Tax=Vagococcus intermedius TaxID=2991418 RepID=A0AAF0I7C5_9ENTE|nr:hypothetical protein [Vagococcus intermedius]WEG74233.1 hypothetical protein OL234_04875 [Vagococcus intermedius]WEG76315.1 hypothetical protein OL235_04880 [Vagococcus intermedius]